MESAGKQRKPRLTLEEMRAKMSPAQLKLAAALNGEPKETEETAAATPPPSPFRDDEERDDEEQKEEAPPTMTQPRVVTRTPLGRNRAARTREVRVPVGRSFPMLGSPEKAPEPVATKPRRDEATQLLIAAVQSPWGLAMIVGYVGLFGYACYHAYHFLAERPSYALSSTAQKAIRDAEATYDSVSSANIAAAAASVPRPALPRV